MPVFKSGRGLAPGWCELEYFDIVRLAPGQTHTFNRVGKKEKLLVGVGSRCKVSFEGKTLDASEGANLDLTQATSQFVVTEVAAPTVLIRMAGRWGDEVGGSGLFPVANVDKPVEYGDKPSYAKTTSFDNHFHDCDEYWIVYEGRGVAVSEGKSFEVGPGDCIATGMGQHHDFPIVHEPVKAVYFETTMEGAKRGGHLWNHKHGQAVPMKDRI